MPRILGVSLCFHVVFYVLVVARVDPFDQRHFFCNYRVSSALLLVETGLLPRVEVEVGNKTDGLRRILSGHLEAQTVATEHALTKSFGSLGVLE